MLVLLNSLSYAGMPDSAPRQKTLFKGGRHPCTEVEETGVYPERRLWAAVIMNTIVDYEQQLQRIRKLWDEARGRPVEKNLLNYLRSMRYEVRHDWFRHVCDLADIDQSHIVTKLKKLDAQYGVSEVAFSTDGPTRYQLKMLKKKLKHA